MGNYRVLSNSEFQGSTGYCGDNYRDFKNLVDAELLAKKVAGELFKKSKDYDNWEFIKSFKQ